MGFGSTERRSAGAGASQTLPPPPMRRKPMRIRPSRVSVAATRFLVYLQGFRASEPRTIERHGPMRSVRFAITQRLGVLMRYSRAMGIVGLVGQGVLLGLGGGGATAATPPVEDRAVVQRWKLGGVGT